MINEQAQHDLYHYVTPPSLDNQLFDSFDQDMIYNQDDINNPLLIGDKVFIDSQPPFPYLTTQDTFNPLMFLSTSTSSSSSSTDSFHGSPNYQQEPLVFIDSAVEPKEEKRPSTNELRRQIHIQSEQKRRAQIKDGFEDLRNELPSYLNKKMSKVALLHRTVQHIQHLKNTQITILTELERLAQENEQLRKFQQDVLQKHALEKNINF